MQSQSQDNLVEIIMNKKIAFLTAFFLVFLVTYSFLAWVDFLPEPVSQKSSTENVNNEVLEVEEKVATTTSVSENVTNLANSNTETQNFVGSILPEKIIFDSLNRSVAVLNPTSRNISDLDNALLSGVVRHPDSATLNQNGAVFILGHSSYLPKVVNESFQAFNGIQNLKWGDVIRIEAGENTYVYRVEKVYKASATDTTVPVASEKKRLILATCNSFGSTDDRYIVEAELSEVKAKTS